MNSPLSSNSPEPRYWFRAKKFGWGWGLPLTWEGWVVFASHLALVLCGVPYLISAPQNAPAFVVYALILSFILLAICWWKGEPPRWRG